MSMIIRRDRPPVKPYRNTPRPSSRFGQGLLPFVPFAVSPAGFSEPDPADRQWAAEALNGATDAPTEPDHDELAYDDFCRSMTPPPAGLCSSCGDWSGELAFGLCSNCFEDAATDASTMCATGLRRVY